MTIDKACSKAISFVHAQDKSIVKAFESNRYFMFEIPYKDEVYCSPIAVNKETGETKVYFPLDNQNDMKTAVEIDVPMKYKRR